MIGRYENTAPFARRGLQPSPRIALRRHGRERRADAGTDDAPRGRRTHLKHVLETYVAVARAIRHYVAADLKRVDLGHATPQNDALLGRDFRSHAGNSVFDGRTTQVDERKVQFVCARTAGRARLSRGKLTRHL